LLGNTRKDFVITGGDRVDKRLGRRIHGVAATHDDVCPQLVEDLVEARAGRDDHIGGIQFAFGTAAGRLRLVGCLWCPRYTRVLVGLVLHVLDAALAYGGEPHQVAYRIVRFVRVHVYLGEATGRCHDQAVTAFREFGSDFPPRADDRTPPA